MYVAVLIFCSDSALSAVYVQSAAAAAAAAATAAATANRYERAHAQTCYKTYAGDWISFAAAAAAAAVAAAVQPSGIAICSRLRARLELNLLVPPRLYLLASCIWTAMNELIQLTARTCCKGTNRQTCIKYLDSILICMHLCVRCVFAWTDQRLLHSLIVLNSCCSWNSAASLSRYGHGRHN